jgi:hypothetical protein
MHGSILALLKSYAETRLGPQGWGTLLEEAKLKGKVYMAIAEYPDAEVIAIVGAASKLSGKPIPGVLDDFGQFIVPKLIQMYGSSVKPTWKTLDFLENVEGAIHKLVRMKNPGAKPAKLETSRTGPNDLVLKYSSPRKLCPLAAGMIKGVANHYHQKVSVTETTCMNRGGSCCTFNVRVS